MRVRPIPQCKPASAESILAPGEKHFLRNHSLRRTSRASTEKGQNKRGDVDTRMDVSSNL